MNHLTLPRSIALSILAVSTDIVQHDQTAAATDWVIDTSGTYYAKGTIGLHLSKDPRVRI